MANQSEKEQFQARPATGQDFAPEPHIAKQHSGTLNTVDIISGGKPSAPHPAPLQLQHAPRQAPDKPPIGTAKLQSDESIILHLEAETPDGKVHGDGEFIIHTDDPEYSNIRKHIGEIHEGEIKFVSPWEDSEGLGTGGKPGKGPVKGEITPGDSPGTQAPGIQTPGTQAPGIQAPGDGTTTGGDQQKGKNDSGDKSKDGDGKSADEKAPDDKSSGATKAPIVGDAAVTGQAPAPIVPASQAFDNTVATTYNAMSAQTRAIIAKKGAVVVPTHHLTDALPELKGQAPRGWPKGSTWDSVDGCWSVGRNEIVVAEERKLLTTGQWVASGRTEPVLRHESGHAVDYTINMMSDLPAFKSAYDDDVKAMPAADKAPLAYFLQSGAGGREETAAEGVADREGGATGGMTFHNDFPKTLKVINDTINAAVPTRQGGQGGPGGPQQNH